MKNYCVPVMVEFGTFITVEAESPEAAISKAQGIAASMVNGCTTTITTSCEDPIEEEPHA